MTQLLEIEAPLARRRGRPAGNTKHVVSETVMLDAAFHAFATRGYEGTTVRELAKALGISHNLINVRFGSKADLWRRAVDAKVAHIAPPVFAAFDAPGLDDIARLRELVQRFCAWTVDNPEFVGLSHAEGRRDTWRIHYLVDAYILPFKDRLDALLSRVAAVRPVRPISTSAFMVMLVQGVGFYFSSRPMLECLGAADEILPQHIGRQVRLLADFILAGLLSAED
jgi:TetR/AcrR family transcriptional regulator